MKNNEQDLRSALKVLREAGRIKEVEGEVDPRYELPAVLAQQKDRSAVIFKNIKGYSTYTVGNLVDRKNYALIAGIDNTVSASIELMSQGLNHPIEAECIEEAPCQEIVITENINLLKTIPVNTFFEKEKGAYISAALITAKDPETGKRNVSINRLLVLDSDKLMIGMSPSHHLYKLLEKAKKLNQVLEVSISIGNHPITLVASNAYVNLGFDEYAIAGGMFGEPLKLTKGVSIEVESPAGSEFVIEAEFIPGEMYEEGLVSEFHGMYVDYGRSPVLQVKAITHRKDPYYQTILPGKYHEHFIIGAMAIETTTYEHLRQTVPSVKDVYVTEGGMGRVHAVISLSNPKPGEGQKACFAAFAHCNLLKQVIVVDDDIAVDDPVEIEWAIAARMRAERDLFIVEGVRADRAEPLVRDGTVTKIGIIALDDGLSLPIAAIPESIMEKVKINWETYQIKGDNYGES